MTGSTVFNNPVESALRTLVLLVEAYPATLDLQKLVYLDYLLVHSADAGGPESLHPPTPQRQGEVAVRRDLIEQGAVLGDDLPGHRIRLVDQPLDLGIHLLGHPLGDLPPLLDLAPQEDFLLPVAHRDDPDLLAHAELGHHPPRNRGGLLDVIRRAGGDLLRPEHELLGHPASERGGQPALEELLGVVVPVFLGEPVGQS